MLYDVTVISDPSPNGMYEIQGGRMLAFPVEITVGKTTTIVSQLLAPNVQDNSIRLWVSEEVEGRSVSREAATRFWHPNRTPHETVTLHDSDIVCPANVAIGLPVGSYFVNVLNLANAQNAFLFRLTDSA